MLASTNNDFDQIIDPFIQEARDQEYYDLMRQFLWKIKLKIIFTKNQEIKFISQDGEIIRIDNILNSCHENPELPFNLEQIKHLQWVGKYQDMKKVGNWTATWKNEILLDVGGEYCQKGMKQGRWKEIFKNYFEKAQVYEVGDYINGFRTGIWSVIYENKLIGGGFYNDQGYKSGQWIDLCDYFQCDNQITYQGEYINGNKVGAWDINRNRLTIFLKLNGCKTKGNQPLEVIGKEKYNQQGQKNGKWVELCDHFKKETQIIYSGEYKNGRKFGIWDIHHQKYSNRPIYLIGCGTYNIEGLKNGRWVEQSENFSSDGQVIYEGQYQNGKKVGKWDIKFKSDQIFEKIGYGSYDQEGLKNGVWLELSETYCIRSEVTYYGEYKNDKKIGKWEINYKQCSNNPFKLVGQGSYNDQGVKNDNWIELSENFWNQSEVIYLGAYQNGRKLGRWDIQLRSKFRNVFQNMYFYQIQFLSGGGTYDEENLKNGNWVDLGDNFQNYQPIILKGVYSHGRKVGLWEEMLKCYFDQLQRIGQKMYD